MTDASSAERVAAIARAKELLIEKVSQHGNPAVRLLAAVVELPDDDPRVIAIADAIHPQDHLARRGR